MERRTFHNPENGLCVLRVKARGRRDVVTVVGHAAQISAGEWVNATGVWANDRQHEPQLKGEHLKATCRAGALPRQAALDWLPYVVAARLAEGVSTAELRR